jgi:hypothetical protein
LRKRALDDRREAIATQRIVIPREGGESSTLRLLDSVTAASGILDRPVKPGDDE